MNVSAKRSCGIGSNNSVLKDFMVKIQVADGGPASLGCGSRRAAAGSGRRATSPGLWATASILWALRVPVAARPACPPAWRRRRSASAPFHHNLHSQSNPTQLDVDAVRCCHRFKREIPFWGAYAVDSAADCKTLPAGSELSPPFLSVIQSKNPFNAIHRFVSKLLDIIDDTVWYRNEEIREIGYVGVVTVAAPLCWILFRIVLVVQLGATLQSVDAHRRPDLGLGLAHFVVEHLQ